MQPEFSTLPVTQPKVNRLQFPFKIIIFAVAWTILIALGTNLLYDVFHKAVPKVNAADTGMNVLAAGRVLGQTFSWKPDFSTAKDAAAVPFTLYAKSALVMNLDTDQVYFSKNPTMRLPMASLTKEMTALLTLERTKSSDVFTVSDYAATVGENTMGAKSGEKYSVDDLLHALFLQSANDASEVLAEGIGGTKENFTQMMNTRAKELSMDDTHYTDPFGLESNGQYITAQDLAIITKFLTTQYPDTLKITPLLAYTIPANETHQPVDLVGQIDLVRTYPGVVGFKTGFTDEAGYCIVTIAQNQGVRLMAIVLGSQNRKIDAVKMLDWAYSLNGIKIKHQPFW